MTGKTNLTLKDEFHTVLRWLYVADPAIFPASNCVLETLFTSENTLFIYLWKKRIFLINIVNIKILGVKFFFKPAQCPFMVIVSAITSLFFSK